MVMLNILSVFTLLYADDTVSWSADKLQKALDAAHNYCENWDLSVNIWKTKVMVFSKGSVRNKPHIKFGTSDIEVVNEFVYLGTTFSSNGSMRAAVLKQIAQARHAMFKLRAIAVSLNLPVSTGGFQSIQERSIQFTQHRERTKSPS